VHFHYITIVVELISQLMEVIREDCHNYIHE
jgi:hypothetical protein